MLHISPHVTIPDTEIDIHAMRAQGAGGITLLASRTLTLRVSPRHDTLTTIRL